MDTFSRQKRSEIMRRVQSEGTTPEVTVTSIARGARFLFVTHFKGLPGKPDFVFIRRKRIIFVNGCFWHAHRCAAAKLPASNRTYWAAKQRRNLQRDKQNIRVLRRLGWKVLVVWECQTKDREELRKRVVGFLRNKELRR